MSSLVSNASANLILKLNRLIIVFIITPVLIHNLGFYDYGIWEVVISLIGYVGILNLGLPSSLVKFISQSDAENDIGYAQTLFRKSMKYMMFVSGVAAVVLTLFNYLYFEVFPSEFLEYQQKYQTFLTLIAAFVVLSFVNTVITSSIEGFQLFATKAKVLVPVSIGINTFIWFNITPDNALILLISTSLFSTALTATLLCTVLQIKYKLLFGKITSKRDFNLKEVISFSLKSFIQGTMYKIQDTVAPVLVSAILNPAMVVFYVVPKNLIGHKRDIEMTITQVFLPYFSYKNVDGKNSVSDYYRFSLILLIITLPISLGILFIGSDFLRLWVGDEIAQKGELIIQVLSLSSIIGSIDPLASKLITSQNKHGIYAKLAPVQLLLFLITSVTLLNMYGVVGISIAVIVNSFIFPMIYFKYRAKLQGDTVVNYLTNVQLKLVLPTLVFIVLMFTMKSFISINSFFDLLLIAAVPSVGFALFSYWFTLNNEEQNKIKSILKLKRT